MEQATIERYSDAIFAEALRRYAIQPGQIRMLDSFESYIFEFERDGRAFILRLGHTRRRSVELIQAEAEWLVHLSHGGAGVAQAVPSPRGHLVEPIADKAGGHFLATAFVKAPGGPSWQVGWTPERHEAYGRLLGRIHALSTRYTPPSAARRPQWDGEFYQDVGRNLPPAESLALARYNDYFARAAALPRDAGAYGLIHFDAHEANLFMTDQGQLTLFDFDDCAYSYFIYDIAIVLFYFVIGQDDPEACARAFLPAFWRGYRQEHDLDSRWLVEIPTFLKLREIDLYGVIHRDFDVNNLEHPWIAGYMRGRKERIEEDVPFLALDFGALAREMT